MTLLIKNGHLIDPANNIDQLADIRISEGKITAIEAADTVAPGTDEQLIDATGLTVIPGLVDCCARLREPGLENKATIHSETIAATKAGITTLCCPPDTEPVIDEPAVVELIHQKAANSGHSHVITIGALTAGLHGEHLSEMHALKQAGCVGLSNCRKPVQNSLILKRAFAYAATFDMCVFIEPDEHWLSIGGCAHEGKIATRLGLKGIPVSAETIAITRALELIAETGVRAHFGRLSSAHGAELIARAKNEQLPVTADVSAHQLHLTEQDISSYNSACHVIPPLRTQRDMEALRKAVADDTIDAICSDHQPHNLDAKQAPFASTEAGISSLETLLPLCLRLSQQTGADLAALINKVTRSPANILGIEAGSLTPGANADICIFNDDEDWQLDTECIHSHGKNTPFYGWNFQGKVKHTIVDGKLLFSD
ncbi:MAG: dihydroorotase [Gammaproteobacteria bacterium]|nr:dihydroorotase [Gammaproteobacteria bacterium]NNJ50931.1 dihydroorotase [Gammaproteobacteria bacterium]